MELSVELTVSETLQTLMLTQNLIQSSTGQDGGRP